jgi:hypothetical protein
MTRQPLLGTRRTKNTQGRVNERYRLVSAVDNRKVGEGARGGQVWDTQIGAGCVTIVPPSVGGAWNLWWAAEAENGQEATIYPDN